MSRTRKILLWVFGSIGALLLLLVIAAVVILPSDWFRNKVRDRIVYEVERASGGRTEIGSFRLDWSKLTAEVTPFVLHGTEPAGEAPLLRAESIKVGLKVISVLKRDIDIALLDVDRPQVNLLVDANGITNLPEPKVKKTSDKDPIEQLLDLAVREVNIRNGELHYGDRKIPLDVRGRNLDAKLLYDFNGPSYQGTLTMQDVTASQATALPVHFGIDSQFRLLKNRVEIPRLRLAMKESNVEVSGLVEDLRNPRVSADVTANGYIAELGPILKLPPPYIGNVNFTGKALYDAADLLRVNGRFTAQHLALKQDKINLQNISIASDVQLANKDLKLRGLTVHALDGVFRGAVDLNNFEAFKVNGQLNGVSIRSASRMAGLEKAQFSGTVNGPVAITGSLAKGSKDLKAGGTFTINAEQGGVPVSGLVEVAYNQRRNSIQLGNSFLTLPSTRLDFSGTLGEQLRIRLASSDLNDFHPALALASDKPPEKLPLQLGPGGSALFEGTVSGSLDKAEVAGNLTINTFEVQNQKFQSLVASLNANPSGAHVSSFALGQGTLKLAGGGDIALREWKPVDASPVSAKLTLQGAQIGKLLKENGQNIPVDGTLSAQANVSGTVGSPEANLRVTVEKPVIYEEPLDRVTAEVRYRGAGVEVINGVAAVGQSRVLLSGAYSHPINDLKNGELKFNVSSENWTIEQIRNVAKVRPGLAGNFKVNAVGTVGVKNAEVFPQILNGKLTVDHLSVDKKPIGDVEIAASTSGEQLTLSLAGGLRGSKITGKSGFRLAGDYPGSGEVTFSAVRFSTVQDLVLTSQGKKPFPADGVVEGHLTFSGPAKKPEQMQAHLELPKLEVFPVRQTLNEKQRAELSLHNEGPIVVDYNAKTVAIRSAHFVGGDTNLQAAGTVSLVDKMPVDVKMNGSVNLGIIQSFNESTVSSGAAVINASVRGTVKDPQFNGRMDLKDASLYLVDFPNGLDNLNGSILFDQRRATIEDLRANTGGGDLFLSGFVGFGTAETLYRLQARANHVRIRYPEGVSATANATLALTGTTAKSLLSGVVTIQRAGFQPKTDVGGLLASAPTPVTSPSSQSEILRNMALDIRIETVPNLQFQTSLTADLQADADLRVRGTAAKPVVLGRVVVSQGEITFFGNKYTITRGEIGFFNPVRIEPVLDLSLETRVRAVQVNINFSGTLQKLNVSYRSDPPLQSNEIIELLAVGRAPGTNSSLASSQTVSNTNMLATGTNSLLGQAVASPVSNRLQRFFGVSRLKIDPQLTGLSAVPQARITVEQQISRDVTLTYVTNLAEANQQIIRFEWALSKTWSVVAVREENGVFGVDFFFKKRFR
jgi:translocation and assembly module TamB